MRVIITGGSGLLGRALAGDLVADGYEVILLSRSPQRVTGLPDGVRVEGWDGRTAEGWGHLADGARAIVNLAGESIAGGRWTEERKRAIVQSRENAGAAVVEAVRAAAIKPQVVIQASGVGYYGPHGDEVLTEAAGPGSDFAAQVCVRWEAATAPVEALGVRRAVIRTGVVLSRDALALQRLMLPYRFYLGGPLGSGRQWFSWIHIADYVAGVRFLMDRSDAGGAFNLSAPEPLRNAEFGAVLGRVMGRPSWFPVPALAMRLLFGEMATVLLDGQRVIPRRLLDLGFRFRYGQADAALRDLLR